MPSRTASTTPCSIWMNASSALTRCGLKPCTRQKSNLRCGFMMPFAVAKPRQRTAQCRLGLYGTAAGRRIASLRRSGARARDGDLSQRDARPMMRNFWSTLICRFLAHRRRVLTNTKHRFVPSMRGSRNLFIATNRRAFCRRSSTGTTSTTHHISRARCEDQHLENLKRSINRLTI